MDTLFDDLYNYIFSYIVNSSCLFVCKKWHELITNNMVKCITCNKIIKIYDTELYATDNYYLECHGYPLLRADTYEVAIVEVYDTKTFLKMLKFLDNDRNVNVDMIISKNNMCLHSYTNDDNYTYSTKLDFINIKITYFTYSQDKIIIHIDHQFLYTNIRSLSKQDITLIVTNSNTFNINIRSTHLNICVQ